MQMTQATHGAFLFALNPDVEYNYLTFLRLMEVLKLATVCRTLRDRVRTSMQSKAWDVAHFPQVEPYTVAWHEPALKWLTGVAKLGMKLRSVQLVSFEP